MIFTQTADMLALMLSIETLEPETERSGVKNPNIVSIQHLMVILTWRIPVGEGHHDVERGQGKHDVKEGPVVVDPVALVPGSGATVIAGLAPALSLRQSNPVKKGGNSKSSVVKAVTNQQS